MQWRCGATALQQVAQLCLASVFRAVSHTCNAGTCTHGPCVLQQVTLHLQVHELTGGELAKLSWGLVQQDVGNTNIFELIADAAKDMLGEMFPRDIAKLTWALGYVNVGARVLAEPLGQQIERHLESFTRAVRRCCCAPVT